LAYDKQTHSWYLVQLNDNKTTIPAVNLTIRRSISFSHRNQCSYTAAAAAFVLVHEVEFILGVPLIMIMIVLMVMVLASLMCFLVFVMFRQQR
jgi:hypothetical protein